MLLSLTVEYASHTLASFATQNGGKNNRNMKQSVKKLTECMARIDSLNASLKLEKKQLEILVKSLAGGKPVAIETETKKLDAKVVTLNGQGQTVQLTWTHYPSVFRPAKMSTAHYRMTSVVADK